MDILFNIHSSLYLNIFLILSIQCFVFQGEYIVIKAHVQDVHPVS